MIVIAFRDKATKTWVLCYNVTFRSLQLSPVSWADEILCYNGINLVLYYGSPFQDGRHYLFDLEEAVTEYLEEE